MRAGGSAGESSYWLSDSAVIGKAANGLGKGRDLFVTVALGGSFLSGFFSFSDSLLTSSSSQVNIPGTGNSILVLSGANIGLSSVSVRLSQSSCLSSSWVSFSSVFCKVNGGFAPVFFRTLLSIGTIISGQDSFTLSFDFPRATALSPYNGPRSGLALLLVFGDGFGVSDGSPQTSTRLRATPSFSSWNSDSSISSFLSAFDNVAIAISVSLGSRVSILSNHFTYNRPEISSLSPVCRATSGGQSLSIFGRNFGQVDPTLYARVGLLPCSAVLWSSDTFIICKTPIGAGTQSIRVTISNLVSPEFTRSFTYSFPIISSLSPFNSPALAGGQMAIFGANFGYVDVGQSVQLGATKPSNPGWKSDTLIGVTISPGGGLSLDVKVTVTDCVASFQGQFSYDVPSISSVSPTNGPTSGDTVVFLFGKELGTPVTGRIGISQGSSATFISVTSVRFRSPAGQGNSLDIFVTIGSNADASLLNAFSYDSPTVQSISPCNAPTLGGVLITVSGISFGSNRSNLGVAIGFTSCSNVVVIMDHVTLQCLLAPGGGAELPVIVSVTEPFYISKSVVVFSYNVPVVSAVIPNFASKSGAAIVSIQGSNLLGKFSSYRVHPTQCISSSIFSDTAVRCKVPAGNAVSISLVATVELSSRHLSARFSYASMAPSLINPNHVSVTACSSVTITGSQFSSFGSTPVSSIASTISMASNWISDSSIVFKTSSGTGRNLFVALQDAYFSSSVTRMFSFDSPLISSLRPMNSPTVGTNEVIFGINFGKWNVTPRAAIAKSLFLSALFVSDSSISGKSSPGSSFSLSLFVSVNFQSSVSSQFFSFDSPVVTAVLPNSAPTSSLVSVTLIGSNFGPNSVQNDPVAVKIGVSSGTVISRSIDHSSLILRPSSGTGISKTVVVTVGSLVNSLTASFSYNAPTITAIVPSVVKHSGSIITIFGTNFGNDVSLLSLQVESSLCESYALVTSHVVFTCTTPVLSGSLLNAMVSVTIDGLLSRINSTIHVTGNGTSGFPALWCGALMFAWGFGSGTYFVDPDARDALSSQQVYCAVLPDGSSGWTKMLQYYLSAYTPTASSTGTIATASISNNAKLADSFINALVGVGKSKEYRFRATSFTTAQQVPEQDLFIVSSAAFDDTAFGQVLLTFVTVSMFVSHMFELSNICPLFYPQTNSDTIACQFNCFHRQRAVFLCVCSSACESSLS